MTGAALLDEAAAKLDSARRLGSPPLTLAERFSRAVDALDERLTRGYQGPGPRRVPESRTDEEPPPPAVREKGTYLGFYNLCVLEFLALLEDRSRSEQLEEATQRLSALADALHRGVAALAPLERWPHTWRPYSGRNPTLLRWLQSQVGLATTLEVGLRVLWGELDSPRLAELNKEAELSTSPIFLFNLACAYALQSEDPNRDTAAKGRDVERCVELLKSAGRLDPGILQKADENPSLSGVQDKPAFRELLEPEDDGTEDETELPLAELEAIGELAEPLAEQGIETLDDLLLAAREPAELAATAAEIGVLGATMRGWALLAELPRRIVGLDVELANLLAASGVADLATLQAADPAELRARMQERVRAAGDELDVDEARVASWIRLARKLQTEVV